MISFLIGDNSFEIERELDAIIVSFDGNAERINGGDLQISQLPDILMGVSLFATSRLIIIRNLSENKSVWPVFGEWIDKISDDIHLVLIEPKPDKRTITFKSLKSKSIVKEFLAWSDRDVAKAEKWVIQEFRKNNVDIDNKIAQLIVRRVGVNQWGLFHAIEKLALVDVIDADVISEIVEPNLVENVFELFETAIKGDSKKIKQMIDVLSQTEDVYRLFALLSSQVFQLAAVASASKDDNVAKDFAVHPYVVQKLDTTAKKISKSMVSKIVTIFADTDRDMKISKAEPWLLVECALMKISNL